MIEPKMQCVIASLTPSKPMRNRRFADSLMELGSLTISRPAELLTVVAVGYLSDLQRIVVGRLILLVGRG